LLLEFEGKRIILPVTRMIAGCVIAWPHAHAEDGKLRVDALKVATTAATGTSRRTFST
jgi:hypothetical protein